MHGNGMRVDDRHRHRHGHGRKTGRGKRGEKLDNECRVPSIMEPYSVLVGPGCPVEPRPGLRILVQPDTIHCNARASTSYHCYCYLSRAGRYFTYWT